MMKKITVMLICVVLSFTISSVAVTTDDGQSVQISGDNEWPMFRHDPQHLGYSDTNAPDTNNILWTFGSNDHFDYSSPVIANGRLYIGAWFTQNIPPYDTLGRVYCVDAMSGGYIWNQTINGSVYTTPAVVDGKVYVGSKDYNVYCLDAENGDFIWNYTTDDWVLSSPTVVNGKVYIGSYDKKAYCLNAENGSLVWEYLTDGFLEASIAVSNGKAYIGTWRGSMYCLNAENGSFIWRYETCYEIDSSPAVADDRIYFGSMDGNLYCLDAVGNGDETTNLIWFFPTGNVIMDSSPAVAYGKVYIGSFDGRLYCVDALDGSPVWSQIIGELICSSPSVADGKVYIGSYFNRRIYCLDAETGDYIWEYKTGMIFSSPAIVENKVFIASAIPHTIYAFQDPAKFAVGEITGGFNISSTIENVGISDATNIKWNVFIRGGILNFVDSHISSSVATLSKGDTISIKTDKQFLGLGRVNITVLVEASDAAPVWKTVNGFALFSYVMILPE